MFITDGKKQLRQEVLARRKATDQAARAEASACMVRSLAKWLDTHRPKAANPVLFSYLPFGDEVDVEPLLGYARELGYATAVPRMIPGTRRMELHVLEGHEVLVPGAWGIREPDASCPVLHDWSRISCMLVPGVAFDRSLGRLGYGGGYYDRFFEELAGQGMNPFKVAPAFHIQLVDQVPMEEHDARMDAIVTEREWIQT